MISQRQFFRALKDFIFPPHCIHCGQYDTTMDFLCDNCLNQMETLGEIETDLPNISRLFCAFHFNPVLQTAVHYWKYKKRTKLTPRFTEELCKILPKKEIDIIVPIPLHHVKKRDREFNQSELLARYIARLMNVHHDGKILSRIRYTNTQTQLSSLERISNVRGAFVIKKPGQIRQKNVLLVDDVFTTGSTMNECAKVLMAGDAKTIIGAAIAKAQ